MLRVRELALDVQRVGQRDEDVLFPCVWWMARQRSCIRARREEGKGGERTVKPRRPRLHYTQALLELGLRGGELRVRPREVLDFLVELLLDGGELLGGKGVEGDCLGGVSLVFWGVVLSSSSWPCRAKKGEGDDK